MPGFTYLALQAQRGQPIFTEEWQVIAFVIAVILGISWLVGYIIASKIK
jgi:hypothetical protein